MSTSTPKTKKANPRNIQSGDAVGVVVPLMRNGEKVGERVVCKGRVVRLFVTDRRDRLKAQVYWEDSWKAYIFTGRDGWEYVQNLTKLEEDNG